MLLRWLLLRWILLRWLLHKWLFLNFNLNKTPLEETGFLGNSYFLLTGCLSIQFFDSPLSQHSQLDYLWLPTSHCAALVWLTGHHAIPLVTKCFPPNPYLGKQKFSTGVASILSMYLCSRTYLDCNQLVIIRDWYLSISKPKMLYLWWRFWWKTLATLISNRESVVILPRYLK